MADMVRRLSWFFVVSVCVSYCFFLFTGSAIRAKASDVAHIVQIRDTIAPGVHHLTGMVMVPETCSELAVSTESISATTYKLQFSLWNEPSVECIQDETPRVFHTVVFAPATGVQFIGLLEENPLTLVVNQVVGDTE
ncbi:hypothetical protein K8R03_04160 [Candidatus Kaiserbacteria bacterium]|nr:hypothetical protein [Candidatus Kaiserbacteria bacterium]